MDKFVVRLKKRCHYPESKHSQDEPSSSLKHSKLAEQPVAVSLNSGDGKCKPEFSVKPLVEAKDSGSKNKSEEKSSAESVKEAMFSVKTKNALEWKKITAENLDLDYCKVFDRTTTRQLFALCEKELEYNTGKTAQIQIFGKWINIPRKQVDLDYIL